MQGTDGRLWNLAHCLAHAPAIAAHPAVKACLQRSSDLFTKVNAAGELPLHLAAAAGHEAVVEMFLAYTAPREPSSGGSSESRCVPEATWSTSRREGVLCRRMQ